MKYSTSGRGVASIAISDDNQLKNYRLANTFLGQDGPALIADSLYDGILSKWEVILNVILGLINASESPVVAARGIGTVSLRTRVFS